MLNGNIKETGIMAPAYKEALFKTTFVKVLTLEQKSDVPK